MSTRHVFCCISAGLLLAASTSTVQASPWTLPQHDLVISSDFSFSKASREYLRDGKRQLYSVGGELQTSNLALSLRYGFTDRFEMELRPNFKQLSYDSDPVFLSLAADPNSLADTRARIVDFDSNVIGAGDMDMAGRYNLLKSSYLMVTIEGGVKLPLGYVPPEPTFNALNPDTNTFDVGDDATLGDGQIDVRAGLLLGSYLPLTRTFARVDTAFNHRFGDPGDQLLLSGKVGQYATDHIIIVGGVRWAKTVIEGTSIGLTYVDLDPTQTAENFDFNKVEAQPLYLDRDFTTVEVGLIAHFEKVELRIAWESVVNGRNYADLSTLNFGVSAAFHGATKPPEQDNPEPSSSEESDSDAEIIEEFIIVPAEEGEGLPEGTEIIEEVIIVDPDGTTTIETSPEKVPLSDPLPPTTEP